MDNQIKISAIVCTHNRERYLRECLESLFDQSINQSEYEILVIDNGSTDNTGAICREYGERTNYRYIFEPVLGLSQARNTGLKEAKGQYVGYIDDDAVADREWLEKALESFGQNPEPDWVGGAVTLVWEEPPPEWLSESYYSALGWVNWGDQPRYLQSEDEWLVGCNSLFKKASLEEIGGFDTRLGRKENLLLSGEEVQVHHKLKAGGGILYYHPDVHVKHHAAKERLTPEYFYKRYYWGGITDYIMSRTLEGIPSQIVTDGGGADSRLGRLLTNIWKSLGIFVSEKGRVQGRIYMSYVVGHFMAMMRYSRMSSES